MIKKYTLLLISIVICIHSYAASFCGYKDYFHLSDKVYPGIYIVRGYSDYDVILEIVSPRSFVIRDGECRSGYAHITFAYDNLHWCILDIKDGPSMNHPTISPTCYGLLYKGLSYDGIGTHSYSIDLL